MLAVNNSLLYEGLKGPICLELIDYEPLYIMTSFVQIMTKNVNNIM